MLIHKNTHEFIFRHPTIHISHAHEKNITVKTTNCKSLTVVNVIHCPCLFIQAYISKCHFCFHFVLFSICCKAVVKSNPHPNSIEHTHTHTQTYTDATKTHTLCFFSSWIISHIFLLDLKKCHTNKSKINK